MKKFKKIFLITLWFIWATYIVIVGSYVYYDSLSAGIAEKQMRGEIQK